MHAVATTLNKMKAELKKQFFERDDFIDMLFLALASGEHAFVIGAPGTGKTDIIDVLMSRIINAKIFECQMSKFRSPAAILGPFDLLELKATGNQFRRHAGHLTDAHIVKIDEVGKMNPILGHELLAALNERIRYEVNGGRSKHGIPLSSAFCTANEMLTDESDDAAALWDRIIYRWVVDYIQDPENFRALLLQDRDDFLNSTTIDFVDLEKAIAVDVPAVTLSEDAVVGIMKLKKGLANEQVYVSDRRWKKGVKALQASAFLDGRDVIYEDDLMALKFVLWETLPQIEKIERLTAACANPFVERVLASKSILQEVATTLESKKDRSTSEKAEYSKEANAKLVAIRDDLVALRDEANGRPVPKFAEICALLEDTFVAMYSSTYGWDEAASRAHSVNKMGALAQGATA